MATDDDVSGVALIYAFDHSDDARVAGVTSLYAYQGPAVEDGRTAGAVLLYAFLSKSPTADVPDSSGVVGQEQTLTADNPNTDGNKFRWSWTSVPSGSSVSNTQTQFPDNGVNTTFDMTDNEGLYHTDSITGGTTFEDTSGNNNDLTISGTVTLGTGPISGGGSAVFGTTASRLDLATPLPTANADWSLSFWFKGLRANTQWRAGAVGPASVYPVIVELNSDRLGMFDGVFIDSGGTMDPADYTGWNQMTVVSAGDKKTYYINGLQVGTLRANITDPIQYLNNRSGSSFLFADEMAEIALWSRPLTDVEAFDVYTQQSGNYAGDEINLTYTPDKTGTYQAQFESAYGNAIASTTASASIKSTGGSPLQGGSLDAVPTQGRTGLSRQGAILAAKRRRGGGGKR